MSFIECYEPEYVRNFMARHPDSPLYVRKVWKNEIRQSLMLTEPESCEAVLNDACAFDLQLTYRPVEENAAELSARDAIVNQAILSTLTLPDLTPVKRRTKNAKAFHDKCENFSFRASNETAVLITAFYSLHGDRLGYG